MSCTECFTNWPRLAPTEALFKSVTFNSLRLGRSYGAGPWWVIEECFGLRLAGL